MGAQIVSFKCVLKDHRGQLVSASISRDVLTSTFEVEAPLRGLARGLQDLKKGEKRRIFVPASEAYGFYDPSKVILFPKRKISNHETLQVGGSVTLVMKSGEKRAYKILQIHKDIVQLDGNHPLAGQDLSFEIEALEVREATSEEINEALNPLAQQLLH